jgi:hypothetical protein
LSDDETNDATRRDRSGRRASARRVADGRRSGRFTLKTSSTRGAPRVATPPSASRVERSPGTLRRNGPTRVFATMLVVPAIFGTVALPAYALMPGGPGHEASGTFSLSVAQAQDVDVSGLATGAPLSVDSYAVTTKAEIEQARLEAERASWSAGLASRGSGSYAVYTVRAEGDDYPWWNELPDDYGGGLSPLRYYYRECVDFVAWRLNRDAGSTGDPWTWKWGNLTPGGGSASSWKNQWDRHGWATSDTPVVGAVAWFTYNHVAYVQSIPGDGTVVLEEYNWLGSHAYHTRTVSIGSVAKYLYPPS